MKIKETVQSVSDGDGTIESARQRFTVTGKRGEITFALSIVHPEGQKLSDIKTTLRAIGRKIENGDQLDIFNEKAA